MKPVTASQPILSCVGPTKLTVGNWSLTCLKDGEIAIHNSDGQQATILKEDLPGFVFESNRGTKHSFTAETSLGESEDFPAALDSTCHYYIKGEITRKQRSTSGSLFPLSTSYQLLQEVLNGWS